MDKIVFTLKQANDMLALHAQGLTDQEIASKSVGIFSAETVRRWRLENQLPSNRLGELHRERLSQAHKDHIAETKMAPGQRHRAAECIKSLDEGWSRPLTRNERRLANCLLDGPKTIFELRLLLNRPSLNKLLRSMAEQGLIIKKYRTYSLSKLLTKNERTL